MYVCMYVVEGGMKPLEAANLVFRGQFLQVTEEA